MTDALSVDRCPADGRHLRDGLRSLLGEPVRHALPIAGLGAPLFVFLSGVGYRLWVAGQVARGKSDLEISKTTIRRGLFVIGTGFVFNILVWLPEDTFIWDVLTFIGTGSP